MHAPVPLERWFCLEMMVKLNTASPTPKADGELRLWIDGKEAFARTDLRYRATDSVKTRMVFDQNYTSRKFPSDFVWYADNRVVARRYVGPMRKSTARK